MIHLKLDNHGKPGSIEWLFLPITDSVAAFSASVGLNIHKGKTKVLKFKAENSNPITLDGETLENVESFTYLGSIIDEQGGSDADVKARIDKARTALLQLKNI
ncbi:unnamed protein product [Schistosoma margrebowiei]|uniref:Uncharacterized protein n=1 Tax=Schistosoma margrebowiei TaxID=48269 RepID=A0A183LND2_9TREM|nr:unnamed protein product [Schistosoma margrebowiei]